MRTIIVLTALSLLAGPPLARAAAPPTGESLSATPALEAQPHELRQRRGLKPGMVVLDRAGQRIGVIQSLDDSRPGRPEVLVQANGARYRLRDADLRLSRHGERAVVTLTRSDLRTRAILNTE
jgi:hypothetical protein